MKLNTGIGNGVKTNADSVSMDFSIGDPAMIIDILRNRLYSNPIQTLVQEYICNARDATREAKTATPIRIRMPNERDLTFRVRDFGCGLSEDRVSKVFVQYGTSTKRTSDEQTGGFGIGAKSAWAYTDSFTIVTILNGVQRTYVAHIGKKASGQLDLIDTRDTDEPNGTEIQIAVAHKDLEEFRQAIYRATFFWDNRPEIEGGHIPEWYTKPPLMHEGGNFALYKHGDGLDEFGVSRYNRGMLVVVDGIPYPVRGDLLDKCAQKFNEHHKGLAALFVGNADVEVAASREAVANSPRTRQGIQAAADKAYLEMRAHVTLEMGSAPTLRDFLDRHVKLSRIWNLDGTYTYTDPTDKTVYTLSAEGQLQSDQLNGVNITCCRLAEVDRKGRTTVSLRSEKVDKAHLDFTHGRFIYADELTTKVRQQDRLRKWLDENRGTPESSSYVSESVFFLTHDDPETSAFRSVSTKLGAVAISSVEVEGRVRSDTEDHIVPIHRIRKKQRGYSRFGLETDYVNLKTNKLKFAYVVKDDSTIEAKGGLSGYARAFASLEELNFRLCFVSNTVATKLATNPQFVEYATLVKEVEKHLPDDVKVGLRKIVLANIYASVRNAIGFICDRPSAPALIKQIKDPFVRQQMLNLQPYASHSGDDEFTASEIGEAFVKLNPDLRVQQDAASRLAELFNSKYRLTGLFSRSYYGNEEKKLIEEVIWYLNVKYEAKA